MSLRESSPYAYDLGEEWNRLTGLPFVFALFLVRKDAPKGRVYELYKSLKESVAEFFSDMEKGRFRLPGEEAFMREYFSNCIDYSLTERHLEALRKFFSFMEEETGRTPPGSISLFRP
ncbi:MAG: MqnA/MqnD/SBP family protein [Aquificota bacterium]|nr:MqnA/MqnD/SBP family protein [Aquificota bacterium]